MNIFNFFKNKKTSKGEGRKEGLFSEELFWKNYPIVHDSPFVAFFNNYHSSDTGDIYNGASISDALIGKDLYINGEYFKAHEYIKRAAECGDPLGLNFYALYKWQINDNQIGAAVWFTQAVKKLFPDAMFNLAQLRLSQHSNRNIDFCEEAFFLLLKASVLGHAQSQTKLADMYLKGYGVDSDINEGLKWLNVAVNNSDPMALNNLGWYHLTGEFVAKDEKKAIELLKRSVQLGCKRAVPNLAYCYLNGIGVDKDVEEAHRLYLRELENMRVYEAIDTYETLAADFYLGRGTERNDIEAMKCLLRHSIERDISPHIHRWILERDRDNFQLVLKHAIESFIDEANNGNRYSQFFCGAFFELGQFVQADYDASLYWYNKSLHNGHSQALWNYKRLYKRVCMLKGVDSSVIHY